MVNVVFSKGEKTLQYKNKFKDEYFTLNFLNAKYQKAEITLPKSKSSPRGVTLARKNNILNKLSGIIPENRLLFWKNLPVSSATVNQDDEDD